MTTLEHNRFLPAACCGALLLASALCGCRSLTERRDAPRAAGTAADIEPVEPVPLARASTPDDTPLILRDVLPERPEPVEDRFVFPERPPPQTSGVPPVEYPEGLIRGMRDPDEVLEVMLNFDAAPIEQVVMMFAAEELLNFGFLIDPELKGQGAISMTVETEMTAREAWEMFEHILWLGGAYASRNPGFIHILPFSKMPRERRLLADHDPMANVEVALVPIYHVPSAEVMGHLQEFLTEGASVIDITSANSLLIVEAPANMPKLRELISRLDARGEAAWPHVVLRCREADAEVILEELNALLPVLGLPVTNQSPSGGRIKLTALPRLQIVVASAALEEVLEEIRHWHTVFDRDDETERENIFFYNVQHSTAAQLADVVDTFFNASTASSGLPSSTHGTSARATSTAGSAGVQGSSAPTAPAATRRPTTSSRPRPPAEGEEDSVFETPVVVYVDEVQNRLTIRTTQRAFALIEALLRRQDVAPRQVMIEAAIAEIRLTQSTEFGFAYAARDMLGDDYEFRNAAVHTTVFGDSGSLIAPSALATGFAMSFVKNEDQFAFMRAVAGDSNVRILSAPQIMAATGQLARFDVGARVPVKTSDYTDVSGTSSRTSYQYEDTGTILEVTPYITAGNEVQLMIMQEVSSAVETTTGVNDTPTILKKVLETVLVIPDGGTVMMGGMIDSESSSGDTGIPVLRRVPLLGWLFRTNSTSDSRTEILVLITVRVIDSAAVTDSLVSRYQDALNEIRERLQQ